MSEQEFKDHVFSFNNYDNRMLDAFFDYWSEPDQRGKMRWQKEKTWELGRRLKRWYNNNLNWNKDAKQNTNLRSEVQAEFTKRYAGR